MWKNFGIGSKYIFFIFFNVAHLPTSPIDTVILTQDVWFTSCPGCTLPFTHLLLRIGTLADFWKFVLD